MKLAAHLVDEAGAVKQVFDYQTVLAFAIVDVQVECGLSGRAGLGFHLTANLRGAVRDLFNKVSLVRQLIDKAYYKFQYIIVKLYLKASIFTCLHPSHCSPVMVLNAVWISIYCRYLGAIIGNGVLKHCFGDRVKV
jgi:hypothetical protein